MDGIVRKPFQGVSNIIRFNWHYYIGAAIVLMAIFFSILIVPQYLKFPFQLIAIFITLTTTISLVTSLYVYDLSDFYKLNWSDSISIESKDVMVNINAGFDEISWPLSAKYPENGLTVFDFYDPQKHTEVSIQRARKVYSVYPGTISISTSLIPLDANSVDVIFLIFSAHEIRDRQERELFFKMLSKTLKPNGKIVLVEHLRDFLNFVSYSVGFLHFYSRADWDKTFHSSDLFIQKEFKITPFVSTFILQRNGTTY